MSRSRAPSKPDRSLSGGFNRAMILRLGLAVVWLPGFALWFYSFGLPNNRPAERWMIWSRIPFDLMDLLDPPVIDGSAPWSWFYLADRLPFFGLALLVWVTSVCLGRTELRVLRLWTCFDRMERLFFAACLGLASTSLLVLGLGLAGIVQGGALLLIVLGICGVELQKTWRERRLPGDRRPSVSKPSGAVPSFLESEPANVGLLWIRRGVVWTLVPFVFCLLLGAMSPQTDFDVVEYHLGGPKEWFLMGRISRLPHNVYTSFPFLTEMLILSGMELSGDWYWGALAGQAIIAGFAPLTAVGLLATGKRWFSPAAGWLAALVWLTTPWAYRISIIAYAEGGLACYLFAAFAVGLRSIWDHPSARENPEEHSVGDRIPITMYGLCGFLAGSAMACKYTGLISAVLPVGVMLFGSLVAALQKTPRASGSPGQAAGNERSVFAAMSAYSVGVLVAIGPWMAKNLMETGNPVFPLAYSLFGGEGRDAAMDYQWRMAHSSHYDSIWAILVDFPVKLTDVVANNDWHSALMFGLAPIAILANWRRKIWFIWAFVGWVTGMPLIQIPKCRPRITIVFTKNSLSFGTTFRVGW